MALVPERGFSAPQRKVLWRLRSFLLEIHYETKQVQQGHIFGLHDHQKLSVIANGRVTDRLSCVFSNLENLHKFCKIFCSRASCNQRIYFYNALLLPNIRNVRCYQHTLLLVEDLLLVIDIVEWFSC